MVSDLDSVQEFTTIKISNYNSSNLLNFYTEYIDVEITGDYNYRTMDAIYLLLSY